MLTGYPYENLKGRMGLAANKAASPTFAFQAYPRTCGTYSPARKFWCPNHRKK